MTKKSNSKSTATAGDKSVQMGKTIPFKQKTTAAATKKTSTSKPKVSDKRAKKRIPVKMLVDYKSEGNYLFDFSYNLGAGGIFINTQSILPRGSVVVMNFTLPETGDKFEVKGEVMWTQEASATSEASSGMGVQFTSLTEDQRLMLNDYVQQFSESYQSHPTAV